MKVLIFAFGKLKTPGMRQAADHYLKLLRHWVPVEEIEILCKDREKGEEKLLQQLEKRKIAANELYILDNIGTSDFTGNWGQRVIAWETFGRDVAFAIGASHGFSASFKNRFKKIVGLGPHTMAHELTRVVLLEQLYRAWSIVRGHPYHHT